MLLRIKCEMSVVASIALLLMSAKQVSMKRRMLLIALGTGEISTLAGCMSDFSSSEPTATPSKQRTQTAATRTDGGSEFQRKVSIDDYDSVPSEYGIEIDVEILRSSITDKQTARLKVTTINNTTKQAISVDSNQCDIFNRSRGGSDDPPGLWLHNPDYAENINRKNHRWVSDKPPDEPRGFPAYGCKMKEYEKGESVSNEYLIWDDYRVKGYLEPGVYRWEENIHISESVDTTDDSDDSFTWGFSIEIK